MMLMALNIITPAMPCYNKYAHDKQGKSYQYPFTIPGWRETIVDKVPCLWAHTHQMGFKPMTL